MKRPTSNPVRIALGGLLLLLAAVPVASADTVSEIIAMLEGGLTEELILEWLEAGDEPLVRPSAAELLRMKNAGASEVLLRDLLRRSGSVEPLSPTMPDPASAATTADPATRGGRSPVRFRLLYAPRFDEEEEPWDLLVYLDGQPLSYVPVSSDPLGLTAGDGLEFELELPVGEHTLRAHQERHWRRRGAWRHASRAAPSAFVFELAAGEEAKVDVEFRQGWGDLTDPLTFRFTQGQRVADLERVGGDPEYWPELCEEAGQEPADDDCVDWGALWEGDAVPVRAVVLEALERFEFRPVPR